MDNVNATGSITNPVYVALHQGTNANLSQLAQVTQEASTTGAANFSALIQQLTVANASVVASLDSIATAIASTLPRLLGSFQLGTGTRTTVVTEPGILASGFPLFTPLGFDAASVRLYLSSVSAGSGFTVASVSTAAGDEFFDYIIVNPI